MSVAKPPPSKPVAGKKRKRGPESSNGKGPSKKRHHEESRRLQELEKRVADMGVTTAAQAFADMPLSDATKRGLKKGFFTKMTDIQAKSLPFSLQGRDVLGAAKTGSGKTLAFLIPVLEALLRKKWGPQDGLGALVISPTRELAMQIFDVLRAIGAYHAFSAGLVIGGKNLKDESDRLSRMNILVATPGRLLQHMDQTLGFECHNLQLLVLDEADRILDMGFAKAMNAIIAHLPSERQTLLFSATQTESVSDLARLSLKSPVQVGVKEEDHDAATPKGLEQHYIICDLPKKLDTLFSFIKTHLQCKALVFFSTCKQVRFAFETFCKLHPGISIMHLHGKQKQSKRLEIFQKFTAAKHAFLFATDIAARGLDFPAVDWVVQVDAPEDEETYIHRVGRTARYQSRGKGLLFLLPGEEDGFTAALKRKNIEPQKIKVKQSQTTGIQKQLQNFAFQDPDIKYLAQRAFISYLRSIYLQKDKTTFKIEGLPLEAFAESLGLPGAPKVKFLTKEMAKQRKNASHQVQTALDEAVSDNPSSGDSDSEDEQEPQKPIVRTKYDRMFERKNQKQELYRKVVEQAVDAFGETGDAGASDDELLTVKRTDHDLPTHLLEPPDRIADISKRQLKIGKSKKGMTKYRELGEKLIFDEAGMAHQVYEMKAANEPGVDVVKLGMEFAEEQRGAMKEIDVVDKAVAKEKKREKKQKQKDREKEAQGGQKKVAVLEAGVEDDGYVSPEFDLHNASDGDEVARAPPSKRRKDEDGALSQSLDDEEMLALTLLRRKRM